MDTIEIHSLSEYIDFVEQISPQYSLSRGQEQDKDLLPSILRKDDNGMALYTKANSKSFIDDFKSNSTNVTKDRYLKKKVHEGIFSILYVLEFGINEEFKDSTTYANEYMRIKSEMVEKNTEEQVQEDLASSIKRFDQFNNWLLKCTKITPYPLSKEFYGIASKSYKFQTSMALILPALYKKIYDEKVLGDISFEKAIEMIQKAMLGSFIEDPHYTASSTNSKEIKKLVNSFGKEN